MRTLRILNLIAFIILVIGGIAWLAMGLFDANIVMAIVMGNGVIARIIYSLVGLSTLWLIFSSIYTGHIGFLNTERNDK